MASNLEDLITFVNANRARSSKEVSEASTDTLARFYQHPDDYGELVNSAKEAGKMPFYKSRLLNKNSLYAEGMVPLFEKKVDSARKIIGYTYNKYPGSIVISAFKDVGDSWESIASITASKEGDLKFLEGSIKGVKESAVDRVILEAMKSGVEVGDTAHSPSGANFVLKKLDALSENPMIIEEGLEKIAKTGKLGKLWSALPIIGAGAAAYTALTGDAQAKSELLTGLDPTGLLDPTTAGDAELPPSLVKERERYNNMIRTGRSPDSTTTVEDIKQSVRKERAKVSSQFTVDDYLKAMNPNELARFNEYMQAREVFDQTQDIGEAQRATDTMNRLLRESSKERGSAPDTSREPSKQLPESQLAPEDRQFLEETQQKQPLRVPASFGEDSYRFLGKMGNVL